MTSKPDKAFIKLHSWQRAISQLKAALGIVVQDGTTKTNSDGSTAFRFNRSVTPRPFQVSPSLRMEGGCFFFGGRVIYFPTQTINTRGLAKWTLGIRFSVEFIGDGTPDTLHIDPGAFAHPAKMPRLKVDALGTIGTNARLRLIAGNYEVIQSGDVFWPLASYDGTRFIQHTTDSTSGHLQVVIQANGDTRRRVYNYPANG